MPRGYTIQPVAGIPESEAGRLRRAMRDARVRSLYCGDMVARAATRRGWIQGVTLGLSAGAVWTALLLPWPEVTAALAAAVAAANVWMLFAGLDHRLLVLAQLRTSWETLRIEYGALWLGRREAGAAARFEALLGRAAELDSLGGAMRDRQALARWERFADSEVSAPVAARRGQAG